jgi:hypothetical protein
MLSELTYYDLDTAPNCGRRWIWDVNAGFWYAKCPETMAVRWALIKETQLISRPRHLRFGDPVPWRHSARRTSDLVVLQDQQPS